MVTQMESLPRVVTLSSNTSWYLFNFRASTIRALLAAGFKVVCLSPKDEYAERLVELGCEWQPLFMDNSGRHPGRDFSLFLRYLRLYRRLRPAAAFHFTIKNNIYGTWAARLLGIPAVNNVSGLGTAFIRPGVVGGLVRVLYRLSQPFAYRVFCQNAEDFELLRGHGLVPENRLQLLPGSGVDLQRFHPSKRIPRAPDDAFRLLYAGRMLADKGLQELVEAIKAINSGSIRVHLSLVGFAGADNVSAIGEDTLNQWGKLPGVRWLGPSDDMPSTYAEADAVVLPSYREGMPRSLLEAGAMGLPAVATDVPGCRHVITHGVNGLLCEARSAASLQLALEQLLGLAPEALEAMGEAGRARVVAEFDEQLVVNSALGVLQEMAAAP